MPSFLIMRDTLFISYKNLVHKNIKASKYSKIKNIIVILLVAISISFENDVLLNKARYTATLVVCRWAGAVFELLKHLARSSEAKDRKNIKKVKWGPTDQSGV